MFYFMKSNSANDIFSLMKSQKNKLCEPCEQADTRSTICSKMLYGHSFMVNVIFGPEIGN